MSASGRGVALAAAALVAFLSPARARAAGASARLVYVRGAGAESCPGEEAIRASVASRLGYDPFFIAANDTLFAAITRDKSAFHAEIRLVDAQNTQRGARDLVVRGSDCSVVVDAIGLTVSLTIDPSHVMGAPVAPPAEAPAPAPEPEPEPPPPPAPPERRVVEPPPPPVAPLTVHVGLGALGAVGTAPAASAGGVLFAGVAWGRASVDLEGRVDLPAGAAGERTGPQVQSWLAAGAIVPCIHFGTGFACPVVALGRITADGSATTEDDALWIGAGGRLGAEVAIDEQWSVRTQIEALATVVRHAIALEGAIVYDPPLGSMDLGLALARSF